MHTQIIILKEIRPYPLAKIQILLGEHKMKALMVSEDIYVNTIQVVSRDLECKHHYCKLEVMSWIVLLMNLKLSRGISYHLISLHQNTTLGQLWMHHNRSPNNLNPLVESRQEL